MTEPFNPPLERPLSLFVTASEFSALTAKRRAPNT
jgi:hypothetical protein